MTSVKFLALLVAILLAVQLISAAPLDKRHKKHKHKQSKKPSGSKTSSGSSVVAVRTGEHPTTTLPASVPQKDGLATNWTISAHPSSVVGLNSIKNDGVALSTQAVTTLKNYAQLASVAYCSVGTVGSPIACASYCSNFPTTILVATFDTSSTQTIGYIARDDVSKEIILSYRGSANIQSFIDDLEFLQKAYTPVSGAYVHIGFYEGFQEARTIVYPIITAQMSQHSGYKLKIVGHSLGGAVAVLQALDFAQNAGYTASVMSVYSYGEPRVGNAAFAAYVDSTNLSIHRSVNQNDIVPHLPPASWGYQHHSFENWIEDASGDTVVCSVDEDSSCSDSVVPFTSIPAHLLYWNVDMSIFAC